MIPIFTGIFSCAPEEAGYPNSQGAPQFTGKIVTRGGPFSRGSPKFYDAGENFGLGDQIPGKLVSAC